MLAVDVRGNGRAAVIRAIGELGLAGGAEVLAYLKKKGIGISRPSVFRYLAEAQERGELSQVELGRTRYYYPKADVAVFLDTPNGVRALPLHGDLIAGLRKVAGSGLESAFVLVRTK